jgi:hypothetical protein
MRDSNHEGTPFSYINSGQFMGRVESLLKFLEPVGNMYVSKDWETDQDTFQEYCFGQVSTLSFVAVSRKETKENKNL